MILDRFFCGINDTGIQKRLLTETGLTYVKAVEITLNVKTAAQSMQELCVKLDGGTTPQLSIHKTSMTPSSSQGADSVPNCYRCGNKGHTVPRCRVKKAVVCHYCRKQGYIRRACKSKDKLNQCRSGRHKTQTVGQVQDKEKGRVKEEEESGSENFPTLCHLQSGGVAYLPPLMVKVNVDDWLVNMKVDTGASHSLMSQSTFMGLWLGRCLLPTPIRLQSLFLSWDVAM